MAFKTKVEFYLAKQTVCPLMQSYRMLQSYNCRHQKGLLLDLKLVSFLIKVVQMDELQIYHSTSARWLRS